MRELRLEGIAPVGISPAPASWGQGGGRDRRMPRPRQEGGNRERMIRMLAPGHDPGTLELEYVVDHEGMMVAIQVRDARTGDVIARVRAEDLWRLASEEAAGGLLLERRG
ncbi:MAG: hypothetical protein WHT63_10080 [Tepidiforma sp.]|jgi:hypothetical protein|nr:hypothetical protein [Tepidiforma sp.]GIW19271.1 MAG: hypothetical protein KatS3mg064_2428 [Tepidiforma sp.]